MKALSNHVKHTNRQLYIICSFLIFVFFIFTLTGEVSISKHSLQRSLCVFSSSNPSNPSSLLPDSNYSQTLKFTSSASSSDKLRILIGILTLPDQYQKRHFLRMIYETPSQEWAQVDIKFIFCNLTKEEQKTLIALEIMYHNDIIILNCKENLNEGKTYTYFSSLPAIFSCEKGPQPPYHYVMKTDDDTYVRVDNLVNSLRPLPREDLYYGYVIPDPNLDPFTHYMSGMGYLISWDLVVWIRESDIPKTHLNGPEDKVLGDWLRRGQRAKNRFSVKWSMYNYPEPPTRYGHKLWPKTIAVHNLKTRERWIQTLQYFNVTVNLKSSKPYHIP